MSDASQQVARRVGYLILAPLVIGLPTALFAKEIDIQVFTAVAVLWLLVALFLIIGHESISEITFWKASIKTDAAAAKKAREEAEKIRDQIREVSRVVVENNYLISCVSPLASSRESAATQHFQANMDALSNFVEPDETRAREWRGRLRELYHGPQ